MQDAKTYPWYETYQQRRQQMKYLKSSMSIIYRKLLLMKQVKITDFSTDFTSKFHTNAEALNFQILQLNKENA